VASEKEIQGRIAQLESELAPFRKWTCWDWFNLKQHPARKRHLEAMVEKGLLSRTVLEEM
jgi:hypothetical protein